MVNKDDLWWEYGISMSTKLSDFGMEWSKLSQTECQVAALWKFQVDVENGGFIQFFCNWGYEAYTYVVEALQEINASITLKLVTEAYDIISRVKNEDLLELWDIPKFLNEQEFQRLEEIDKQLCEYEEKVSEYAYNYFVFTFL